MKLLPSTVAMLYAADRNEHVKPRRPESLRGLPGASLSSATATSFRAWPTSPSIAGIDYVLGLNKDFPLPQCLIFIDTPVEVCQKRLSGRGKAELFDGLAFQSRVREQLPGGHREVSVQAAWRYRSSTETSRKGHP